MVTIDIRENNNASIGSIRFGTDKYLNHGSTTISIENDRNVIDLHREDIFNLTKALEKAKELGWYEYPTESREFEEGAFYPCRLKSGVIVVACYSCTGFYHLGHTFSTNDFQEIGSKVEIKWDD